jgi:hypothetical protein
MPILFLILGEKIGLHLSLAAAPVHCTCGTATRAATRSAWSRPAARFHLARNFRMGDLALESGL